MEAPGVEPCRRHGRKPKRCADLHKVHAGLDVWGSNRLRVVGTGRNRLNSGRLGDWWATDVVTPGSHHGSGVGSALSRIAAFRAGNPSREAGERDSRQRKRAGCVRGGELAATQHPERRP